MIGTPYRALSTRMPAPRVPWWRRLKSRLRRRLVIWWYGRWRKRKMRCRRCRKIIPREPTSMMNHFRDHEAQYHFERGRRAAMQELEETWSETG